MLATYNRQASKKATSLTINSDLLKKAKEYKINLSKNFEAHLAQLVKKYDERVWREENKNAIEEFNKRVEKEGCFSDGLRRF